MPVQLTPRLATAVGYVRPGRRVADIGTDHAYLPIALCEAGLLSLPDGKSDPSAVAADINRGPVERAALHIATAGLSDRIRTVQTDGLHGLDGFDPADIIIFGMGGELIASILAAAPWVATPTAEGEGRRLILQPMTHAERLREYLMTAGFVIVGETVSREGARLYQTLCAEVGESRHKPSLAELAVGEMRLHARDAEQMALYRTLIKKTLATETAARNARREAARRTAAPKHNADPATDPADELIASLAEELLACIPLEGEISHVTE